MKYYNLVMTEEISEVKLPFEEKIKTKGWTYVSPKKYLELHKETLKDGFWLSLAQKLDWFKKPTIEKTEEKRFFWKWFPDGVLNMSYLCLDSNLKTRKNKVAFFWLGEDGKEKVMTYGDYYRLVNRLAYALYHKFGIRKGDAVSVYMPLIPETPAVLLALARIGAVFSVVFSGFSSQALHDRIIDSKSKLLITADGYYRRGKKILLQENVRNAIHNTDIQNILVFRRLGEGWEKGEKESFSDEILDDTSPSIYFEPEKVESSHPLFILYTSGTTGKPKGILHDTGGYAVLLYATMKWVFDASEDDVFWCTADVGWITGHSYVVFGPMMLGLTSVMYEGVPDYPHPGIWWEIIERYGVSIFYTSPTAIRMLMKYPDEYVKRYDLSSLRLLHSVGEPINPEAWTWFFEYVGGKRCPVGSTWWMTETGGVIISHTPGWKLVPLKSGTNAFPIPGCSVSVLRADGTPADAGERGFLVIDNPFPGMLLTIYGDDKRYVDTYWSRFEGKFYAGDYAIKDEDGYIWVLGRADEVIKIAGHRIGTYEIESSLVGYEGVVEAAVAGVPDEVKGEVPVAFVVLKEGVSPSQELKQKLINIVRNSVGAVAVPKDIFFVSKLPKTRSGKIMRRLMKAVFVGKELGDVSTLEDEATIDEVSKAFYEFKEELKSRSSE
ncbi:MAG: acetate--CoA ligase [Candidatus Calescibacterium sp.]|nr:acetate--CoA ligase [Candidatus Calescibacterium sp.]MCX7733976.1 acetate--CoA ligase [bacterium]MDW8086425.1 acetate--CoA ligase [Candidatus Calescibacterium sp.]